MTELTTERLSEAEREIRQALALTSSRYVKRAYEGLDLLLRAARERDKLWRWLGRTSEGDYLTAIQLLYPTPEDGEQISDLPEVRVANALGHLHSEIARLREDVNALAEAAEDVPRILRANGMPGDYANVLAVKVDAALARPGIAALGRNTDG